jgi:hypothetical protein
MSCRCCRVRHGSSLPPQSAETEGGCELHVHDLCCTQLSPQALSNQPPICYLLPHTQAHTHLSAGGAANFARYCSGFGPECRGQSGVAGRLRLGSPSSLPLVYSVRGEATTNVAPNIPRPNTGKPDHVRDWAHSRNVVKPSTLLFQSPDRCSRGNVV